MRSALRSILLGLLLIVTPATGQAEQWTAADATNWAAGQPWLVGANYIPADASNALEMWQEESFDPARIELELGWAERLGFNTLRVFLHDLLWQQDATAFTRRIDRFLAIADRHHLRVIFVLFDSCWDPDPRLGPQAPPVPGVHNSRWVQSPGAAALDDERQWPRLQAYVEGVVGAFANDRRILAWDIWNEPDNINRDSYFQREPADKIEKVRSLLPQAFAWARMSHPTQPLTSAVWRDPSTTRPPDEIEQIQLSNSDIVSFHSYDEPDTFERQIVFLASGGRPILCTEYMARPRGSTFEAILPIAARHHVGAINWGFVNGNTQTHLPWDSWQTPYVGREPPVWFHDIFQSDGRAYRDGEIAFIRQLIDAQNARAIEQPRKAGAGTGRN
ncbi:1,4-beta-xylanase [Bradyrhizobium sp. USDA 4353]